MHGFSAHDAARRFDPTGTADIRSRFRGDMARRWARLRQLTANAIMVDDVLGLGPLSTQTLAKSADPVREFQTFIDGALFRLFGDGDWTQHYLDEAAARARSRAYKLVPAIGSPQIGNVHTIVASSAAAEMQGVMEAVSQRTVRAVAQALLAKLKPRRIVSAIAQEIGKVGATRGAALAEMSVNSAFNQATLDTFESLGFTHVSTIPEHVAPGTQAVRRLGGDAFDYSPNQPRVPSGVSGGGQFASAGGAPRAPAPEPERPKTRLGRAKAYIAAIKRFLFSGGKHALAVVHVTEVIQKEHPDWHNDRVAATLVAAYLGYGPYAELARHLRERHPFLRIDALDEQYDTTDLFPGVELVRSLYARITGRGEVVEVLTAGDDKVCQICQDISDNGPYRIAAARKLIPAHPNCRCAFVPYFDKRFAKVEKE